MAQNWKPLNGSRTCRGSYDWLSPGELESHMAEILHIEDKQELCKDCDGVCRQGTDGFYLAVTPSPDGQFHSTMRECKRYRAKKEQKRLNL